MVYLASADWMPRNFFRRVEIAFPIEDPALRDEIINEVLPAFSERPRQGARTAAGRHLRAPETGGRRTPLAGAIAFPRTFAHARRANSQNRRSAERPPKLSPITTMRAERA